jgi:hypothetical protein
MSGLAWESAERRETEYCRIACESAAVTVSSFRTGNGLRLKLTSERSGDAVLLDATVLEALCYLTPQRAAEIIRERTEDSQWTER